MSKLVFSVAYASGADPEYPSRELNTHSPHTRGWQSPRFCDFPQEIGLQLEAPSRLTQVQLLSHQSKIATRIELFVGKGASYEAASWRRLGYLSLDDNSRSNYEARELKSVYIDSAGQFLKLLVHKCYANKHNIFSQVGIVAINLLGESLSRPIVGGAARHGSVDQGWGESKDECPTYAQNLDAETAGRIHSVVAAKERAVQDEDYDKAKRLKAAEAELQALGARLSQLEVGKRAAIEAEDYDRAKEVKFETDAIKNQIRYVLQAAEGGGSPAGGPGAYATGLAHDRRPAVAQGNYESDGYGNPYIEGDYPRGRSGYGGEEAGYHPNAAPTRLSHGVDPRSAAPVDNYGDGRGDEGANGHGGEPLLATPGGQGRSGNLDSVGPSGPRSGGLRHSNDFTPGAGDAGGPSSYGPPGDFPYGAEEPSGDAGSEPGVHPLDGVPNHEELPVPEPLPVGALSGEGNDLAEVALLWGDYLVRCLLSKVWGLREAALVKAKMGLPALLDQADAAQLAPGLCKLLLLGCEDKIAQVCRGGYLTPISLSMSLFHCR